MPYAPIALFVYNRPAHALKCLESLSSNPEAEKSGLYIFADGPKPDATAKMLKAIEDTRLAIRKEKWCREVFIQEEPVNKGLADSIMDGVSALLEKNNKLIVLEDDNVLSPGCLKYLNDALTLYENEPRVMHISSFMFPVEEDLPDTFFYMPTTCMGGWATWQRAWKHLDRDPEKLLDTIEQDFDPVYFNLDNHYDFMGHLKANAEGRMNSWAIRWQASVYINNGLCLHPGKSLAHNIGFDDTGIHSNLHHKPLFHHTAIAEKIEVKPIPLVESIAAREAMIRLYDKHYKPGLARKVLRKVAYGFNKVKKMWS